MLPPPSATVSDWQSSHQEPASKQVAQAMWATRPALTAAMGRTYREKYPVSSDASFFPAVLVGQCHAHASSQSVMLHMQHFTTAL